MKTLSNKLLSRTEGREAAFARDNHLCVNCSAVATEVHHIIERRLFVDGGYYLDNLVSVCNPCHLEAERTTLSPETIREKAGITKVIVPAHMYPDVPIDKWGNVIMNDGRRMRGELFQDESVQKALSQGNVLHLFTKYVKYPRTWHMPTSPGVTKDDRKLQDMSAFEGRDIVATLKMDGGNVTLYDDYLHARSLESENHPSLTWIKNFHARIAYDIGPDIRLCGENLYAKHSIAYEDLNSYFLLFSVWCDNLCLSWDATTEYAELLDLHTVPVLYRGIYDHKAISKAFEPLAASHEGYVIRITEAFRYGDFSKTVAKWVRAGHVRTSHHWKREAVIPNHLGSA